MRKQKAPIRVTAPGLRIALLAVLFIALATPGAAQETAPSPGFSLSGTVSLPKKGDIYIRVITREQLEKNEDGDIKLRLKPGPAEEQAGEMAFSFPRVPAGTYAIQAFQDVNNNAKLDTGMFGPKEPWGTYRHARPRFRAPKFDEMAFSLDRDLADIRIQIK